MNVSADDSRPDRSGRTVRIGDVEREAAIEVLRKAAGSGRITVDHPSPGQHRVRSLHRSRSELATAAPAEDVITVRPQRHVILHPSA